MATESETAPVDPGNTFLNRELSWLGFARRVLVLVSDPSLPLLERAKFAGITGMLHDEFFMKRMSGLKRQIGRRRKRLSLDGKTPEEEFQLCREELLQQGQELGRILTEELRPGLVAAGHPILDYKELDERQKAALVEYFDSFVQPILTPLAVDPAHPFPFISNLGLNLAILMPDGNGGSERFIRVKVPDNRPRWVPVPGGTGVVPLEQVIAANLHVLYPSPSPLEVHLFRVTRGAEGEPDRLADLHEDETLRAPGSIIRQVTSELKARRFAGVVRLQVDPGMPKHFVKWLARQLGVETDDIYQADGFLALSDLMQLRLPEREDLHFPRHEPVTHPRLLQIDPSDSSAIFHEIARGDILLHHPYHSFDTSVLRFLESAAADPAVLAIKVTIYRTSGDSPIVKALAEAARRGKQVAVLVEITARFDEAPNIAWGRYLENEGVHVAYGAEHLKTHVKLALVVREEAGRVRRYVHVGSGNYHTGTARVYEDVGILTGNTELCDDVATVFNALTGTTPYREQSRMLIAPVSMRRRFIELIRREAEHARAGRPCGIHAKMNQLQDSEIIGELYRASQAGVPIELNVRGLCCLRPGVAGLSDTIHVFGAVGRFLEHSRIYRFTNGGEREYYIGSADWMKRNLSSRIETVTPVLDEQIKLELEEILETYEDDNCSVWDCGPDGVYVRREPNGEARRAVQDVFIRRALEPRERRPRAATATPRE